MGTQIIRQPDGRLAVFDTITDTLVLWDKTADEIVEWSANEAAERARADARAILEHVEAGRPRRAYFQFAVTWDEAVAADRENDGDYSTGQAEP
ncbi:hypothetical protein [Microbispora sp. CA-102843]|uniref:hypothetical protein n=1 Tax=Microbispora sp. CA-102843 TaxID=3239952 RepID=UPI003D908476